MGFVRFLAGQLRAPSGWFGALLSRGMNRANSEIIRTTIELLEIRPQQRVLEVGFGGGSGLRTVLGLGAHADGVDISHDMLRRAQRRFQQEIAAGRLTLQFGDVSSLPFPEATFDRVFTVNTVYFWADPLHGLGEIRRVLKAGGRAGVSIRSKQRMQNYSVTRHGFRLFSPEDLADLMRQAGFLEVRIDHRHQEKTYDQVIVTGSR